VTTTSSPPETDLELPEEAWPSSSVRRPLGRVGAWVVTLLAGFLVWFALVAPNELRRFSPEAFLRIPVEGLVVVGLVVVLPPRARRVAAAVAGLILGLLTITKLLDIALFEVLNRPFNPVTDWSYTRIAVETLSDSVGGAGAHVAVVGAGVFGVAIIVFTTLSALRLAKLLARHRTGSLRAGTVLGVGWLFCAVLGAQLVPGAPIASTSAAGLAYDQARAVSNGLQDHAIFAKDIADDRFQHTPGDRLLTGLRGKDVIFAFVESYGKVAVDGSSIAARDDAALEAGTRRLRSSGFSARSAYLTSPTFGGISWLAHSTLQSGVWVDGQQRYNQLVGTDRLTLSGAFKRAGWRTVGDVPSNNREWPQGTSFYHYDKLYDRRNVGYHGPTFAYASMPDQFVLSAFHRLELAKRDHRPVMAEIDLVSSHEPWTRIPHMIGWNQVGDGSVFGSMDVEGVSQAALWSNSERVRAAYGKSIRYSVNALVSFVQHYADDNLVLVMLGDHQPATLVTGEGASHDVPISIVAHDPRVLDRISGWGWRDGLRPRSGLADERLP
jgi:hypothetical protein